MVRIVIAPDKFKGSASSFAVCDAAEKGLMAASPSFQITKCPMADGGDGFAEVIGFYTAAQTVSATVHNPLFQPIEATWRLSADKRLAVVEMAKASGLALLLPSQYNPEKTSSYGTGQLVKQALERGVKQILLGLGGSATTDGGTGMAAALGYRFLDSAGRAVVPTGENLARIRQIDSAGVVEMNGVAINAACDVTNYLCGESGAARVYGPQKGASPGMVTRLEEGLLQLAAVVKRDLGKDLLHIEGGGAAGGAGAGCVAFLGARLVRGIDLVASYAKLEENIRSCDLVLTGEGRLDTQTLQGKVISGVVNLARKYKKPVLVLCGGNTLSDEALQAFGIAAAVAVAGESMSLEDAMKNSEQLIEAAAYRIGNSLRTHE